jgi:hypothetical protein
MRSGTVRSQTGEPLDGLHVQAFAVSLRNEIQLGEAVKRPIRSKLSRIAAIRMATSVSASDWVVRGHRECLLLHCLFSFSLLVRSITLRAQAVELISIALCDY